MLINTARLGARRMGTVFFSVMPRDRTRDTRTNLNVRRNMRNFFMLRMIEHCNRQPRGVIESPFLEPSKICLNSNLCNQ